MKNAGSRGQSRTGGQTDSPCDHPGVAPGVNPELAQLSERLRPALQRSLLFAGLETRGQVAFVAQLQVVFATHPQRRCARSHRSGMGVDASSARSNLNTRTAALSNARDQSGSSFSQAVRRCDVRSLTYQVFTMRTLSSDARINA